MPLNDADYIHYHITPSKISAMVFSMQGKQHKLILDSFEHIADKWTWFMQITTFDCISFD